MNSDPSDKSFFSIIIPTYNSSATVKNCLDSVFGQNFKDFEVLVIDGGSGDSTLDILGAYNVKSFPVRWLSAADNGVYDAMNKGIAIAKGEYLYFLGSDDTLFDENVLSAIAGQLIKTSIKVLYGNVMIRGNNPWVSDGQKHAGEFNLKRILSHNICHQSIFYNHSVFAEAGNYNIKYRVFADHDLNLRCFARYKFAYTDMIIANFNVGGASTLLADEEFEKDKPANIIKYFFNKLHTRAFVDLRLYIQQAAFSKKIKIGFWSRLYCLLVYAKLKTQSLLA